MNFTKAAIIFTFITIPFYFMVHLNTIADYQNIKYKNNFNRAIANAIYDAKFVMNKSAMESVNDENKKHMNVDEEAVINAFLSSYYLYFNAKDELTKATLRSNILALIILDYDGFYIYGAHDAGGHIDHVLSAKHPYKLQDESKAYFFNFGDEVEIFDLLSSEINYSNIDNIFSNNTNEKNAIKSKTINDCIVSELKQTLKNHKKLGENIGSRFDYFLPIGENSVFSRTIDTVGLISIIEGETYPKMTKVASFNFTSADIKFNKPIYAFKIEDNKYYSSNINNISGDYEIYNSELEAAHAGYFPYIKDISK